MKWLIGFALFFVLAASVEASHYAGYKWTNTKAQNLTVYDATLDSRNVAAVAEAVATWNLSPVVEMTIVRVPGDCADRNGAVVICEVEPCSGNWALITLKGGKISKVRIGLMSECATYEHLSGACHELGHALGLNHRDLSANSCLANNGSLYPEAHDYEQLEAIY